MWGDGETAERLYGEGGGERQRVGEYFVRVVGMVRVDATGGASPLPYEKWVG